MNSSSAAVTSRCAADWVAPASGTRAGTPTLRTAALISTSTHQTSCTQASQMTTDKIRRIAVTSSWLVSTLALGMVCGIGRPTTVISAIGTPMVSAVSTTTAAPRPHIARRAAPDLDRRPQAGNRRRHQQATSWSAVPQAR